VKLKQTAFVLFCALVFFALISRVPAVIAAGGSLRPHRTM
jgi:hypothetical protein